MTEKNLVTAIRDTLHDEMAADDRIVLIGQDVGARGGVFKVSEGFMAEFGEQRVIDAPLAESGIVGVAIGMALHGLLPVAEIAATIAEQAMFDLDAPIVRIGGPDIPAMPFAGALEHYYMEPEPDHIFVAMRDLAHF